MLEPVTVSRERPAIPDGPCNCRDLRAAFGGMNTGADVVDISHEFQAYGIDLYAAPQRWRFVR